MIQKSFDLIDWPDIEDLIANEVQESSTLEYKQNLPGGTAEERKEFLSDVSAFANATGGDLVYGVSEKRNAQGKTTGLPEAVTGLAGLNSDEVILRLDNMIRDGLAPRINGIHMKPIVGFSVGPVLLVRIPRSWSGPHMLTHGDSRFYARNNAGKYALDVTQIRAAFALSETFAVQARRFRDERLGRIVAGETPMTMAPTAPKRILHIIPASGVEGPSTFDLMSMNEQYPRLQPLDRMRGLSRYNLDGLVFYGQERTSREASAYLQFFRNGVIESVTTAIVQHDLDDQRIASNGYENDLILDLKRLLPLLKSQEIELPLVILLSFTGMKGRLLIPSANFYPEHGADYYRFDRDVLLLPDVLLDDYTAEPTQVLRPLFDVVWQSAGWDSCKNYDVQGHWAPNAGVT